MIANFQTLTAMITLTQAYTLPGWINASVAASVSSEMLSGSLAYTVGGYPGARAIAFELATGNVVANSWGAPVADHTGHSTSTLNNEVMLQNLGSYAQDATVAWAIKALGGANALRGPAIATMDTVLQGYTLSVRDVTVAGVANLQLRMLTVIPTTAAHFAFSVADTVSASFGLASSMASAMVSAPGFQGIPTMTDSWLKWATATLVAYTGVLNEVVMGDTSVPGSFAFVDVTTAFGDYRWLVRNSTMPAQGRLDFIIPNPVNPLNMTLVTANTGYNALARYWYTTLSPKPGVMQVLPAAASATSGTVNLLIGTGYRVNSTGVVGAAAVSFGTKELSLQLSKIVAPLSGAAALVYEVSTTNVIGVSWPGESLIDLSQYNTSAANPIILTANLTSLKSNMAMRGAIDFLGGAAVLSQMMLPANAWDAAMPGWWVAVRDVRLAGATFATGGIRAIVVTPMTPQEAASQAAASLAGELQAAAVALNMVAWSTPALNQTGTTAAIPAMWSALRQTLMNEIWVTDNSSAPYAMADLFEPSDVYVTNSTYPCLTQLALNTTTLVPMGAPIGNQSCSYNPFLRTWYTYAVAANGAVAATPMIANFQTLTAMITLTQAYTLPGWINASVAASVSSEMLSGSLAYTVGGYPGARAIAFELATGNVVANSWGAPVADHTGHSTSTLNNEVMLQNLGSYAQDATVAWAIKALGGANALRGPAIATMDTVLQGYTLSVRDVTVAGVANLQLRMLTVIPTTAAHFAFSVADTVSASFGLASSMASAMVSAPGFQGIPTMTDSWLKWATATLVAYKGVLNEVVMGDTSVPGSFAFVDLTTAFGDYRWLVRNSTMPAQGRLDFIIPNPVNPLNMTLVTANTGYNALARYWYTTLSPKPGVMQVLPAAASATSGTVNLLIGTGYRVNSTGVVGAAAVSFGTKELSLQLSKIVAPLSGAAALVYEVSTTNVIGVSWPGESLIDLSQYNTSAANPIILTANLTSLKSNMAMRGAIDFLGGAAVLSQMMLPANAWDAAMPGWWVAVRDVRLAGATFATGGIRAIVVTPMTPQEAASQAAASLAGELQAAAVALNMVAWSTPALNQTGTTAAIPAMWSALRQTLMNEIWVTDNSSAPYAMADLFEPSDVYVTNSTYPCLTQLALNTTTLVPMGAPIGNQSCSYNPFLRTWYTYAVAANGAVAATPMIANFQTLTAMITLTQAYTLPGWINASVAASVSSEMLSGSLAYTVGGYPGARAIAFELATGNVVANSWGAPVADHTGHSTSTLNNEVMLQNLGSYAQDATVAWAIKALGGANALRGPAIATMDTVLQGYTLSVRDVTVAGVANLQLRMLTVIPTTAAHFAFSVADTVSASFGLASSMASAMVSAPGFQGIPTMTDSWLKWATATLVAYTGVLNEVCMGDTSVPGSFAFVDVTTAFGDYRWLVRNSTMPAQGRLDFIIPNPVNPLNMTLVTANTGYNALARYWYTTLSPKPGVMQVLPAAASATSGTVNLLIGTGYRVNSTGVVGAAAVSFGTKELSLQLSKIVAPLSGAAALVYEVSTTNVIGVSWPGESLIDLSQYNTSAANPIILTANLTSLKSNMAMRGAIDFLGGAAVLSQMMLPANAWDAAMPGWWVAVRDVRLAGATFATGGIRAIVVTPMTPQEAASQAAASLAGELQAAAVALNMVAWSTPALNQTGTTAAIPAMWSALRQTLMNEIWVTDNSSAPYAMADLFEPSDVYVTNSTYPCLTQLALNTTTLVPMGAPIGNQSCSYNPFLRTWYTYAVAANGAVAATPMIANFQTLTAMITLTQAYTLPGWINASVAASVSSEMLSGSLAYTVGGYPGARAIAFELATGNVVANSWGAPVADHTGHSTSTLNNEVMLQNLGSYAQDATVAWAIKALGGANALRGPAIATMDTVLQGYTLSVRDVTVAGVANLQLRMLTVIPTTAAHFAFSVADTVSASFGLASSMASAMVSAPGFQGIPTMTDSWLKWATATLVAYKGVLNEFGMADNSLPGSYSVVDVTTAFGDYRWLVRNSTMPAQGRLDFIIPNPVNPLNMTLVTANTGYNALARYWYTTLSPKPGVMQVLPAAASATSGTVNLLIGTGYRVNSTGVVGAGYCVDRHEGAVAAAEQDRGASVRRSGAGVRGVHDERDRRVVAR
jgi:hypothetical protein